MSKALSGIKNRFVPIKDAFAQKLGSARKLLSDANLKVTASMLIPGLGQLLYKRFTKGILFLLASAALIVYFIIRGAADIFGFFTLGDVEGNAWYGVEGDNSIIMLIMGILGILAFVLYVAIYIANIKDAYSLQKLSEAGKPLPTFKDDIAVMFDKSFYKTALTLPVLGVCVFSILPIVFMILIAFTNYGGDVIPPKLVDWVGFENFGKILTLGQFAPTFFKIFGWNMIWAVLSTAFNYFAGLGLALLLNKKCVKGKAVWRAFPVLAYAIPGFITLLGFKFMFSYGGPINYYLQGAGGEAIGFLGIDSTWTARIIGLLVNAWISVPSIMLLATGILSNINTDLYEAARIDGANAWHIFIKITFPYVIFATTPVLISQFIGNFNNFGIFYFLRGGLYSDGYFLASDTDLLINWLYNMSIDNNYYSIGAAISLIIFAVTSMISLGVYVMSPSYKQEETFR